MAVIDRVRLGTREFGYTSVASFIDHATPFAGWKEIGWGQSLETELVYAGRRDGTPLGMPYGQYKPKEIKFTMLEDSFDGLTTYLATRGALPGLESDPGSYGATSWDFTVQVAEDLVQGINPITWVAHGLRITDEDHKVSVGTEALFVEVTCKFLTLSINGKTLYSQTRSSGI